MQSKSLTPMNKFYFFYTILFAMTDVNGSAQTNAASMTVLPPKEIVKAFLKEVRSGAHPENAVNFMADSVLAHQLNAENPVTVTRSPSNYTQHVREFIELFGQFEFEVTELLADGDKVYVRWKQTGKHLKEIDGFKPTGLPLIEYTSVVYRIDSGKIVEYWLQMDRLGFNEQLRQNANSKTAK